MALKDISNVISLAEDIIICKRIEYDNVNLPMKSKKVII